MNVKLRKRHRYLWFIIGIGLPLLCLEALEGIQTRPIADIPRVLCPSDVTDCGTAEPFDIPDPSISISLTRSAGKGVVDINYQQPLVSAFTLAYLSTSETLSENARLLGSLNEMGDYHFEMEEASLTGMTHIIVYDKLNANTLYVQPLNELQP